MPKAQDAHLAFGFRHAINDQVILKNRKADPRSSLQISATIWKCGERFGFRHQFFYQSARRFWIIDGDIIVDFDQLSLRDPANTYLVGHDFIIVSISSMGTPPSF